MAIDQRDITSQLRMMDDRALQQYAAMHKADPYVFPLAFQESQNRQKVRMSGQAQMAGQEQPKVADAALMAMTPRAPQAQGISNLPAPNMQRMADGGIAGYEDDEEGLKMCGRWAKPLQVPPPSSNQTWRSTLYFPVAAVRGRPPRHLARAKRGPAPA